MGTAIDCVLDRFIQLKVPDACDMNDNLLNDAGIIQQLSNQLPMLRVLRGNEKIDMVSLTKRCWTKFLEICNGVIVVGGKLTYINECKTIVNLIY
jgi:hypothetical protein